MCKNSEQLTDRQNADASQNKKSCNQPYKPTAHLAHLVLPDTQANASQNQKRRFLANAPTIITILTLLKNGEINLWPLTKIQE